MQTNQTNFVALLIGISAAILNGLINLNSNETELVKYISILFIIVEIVAFWFSSRYTNYTWRLIILGSCVLVFQITLTTYYGLIELSSRGESYESKTSTIEQKKAECKSLQAIAVQAQSAYALAVTEMASVKRRQEVKDSMEDSERKYVQCKAELEKESSHTEKKTLLNQAGETIATWIVLIRSVLLALCSLLFLGVSNKLIKREAINETRETKEAGIQDKPREEFTSSVPVLQERKAEETTSALADIEALLAKTRKKKP